jgi:hypothetical protein
MVREVVVADQSFGCHRIKVGSLNNGVPVRTEGAVPLLIRENEQDVRTFWHATRSGFSAPAPSPEAMGQMW